MEHLCSNEGAQTSGGDQATSTLGTSIFSWLSSLRKWSPANHHHTWGLTHAPNQSISFKDFTSVLDSILTKFCLFK